MLKTFLDAAIPEPVACCMVRLRPFSLGHYFLLKKFCPAYLDNDKHDLVDLIASCLICSQMYQQTIDDFSGVGSDVGARLKEWGKKLAENKDFNFAISSNLFQLYLSRGFNFPVVKSEAKDGLSLTSPDLWPVITLSACMSKLGQSFTEAINQPLSLSRWLVASYATTEGSVEIVDIEQLRKDQESANKFVEELKAKGAQFAG